MPALLGQTGLVEHEHPAGLRARTHLLTQPVEHAAMIPRALVDKLLQRLVTCLAVIMPAHADAPRQGGNNYLTE
ncbi:hypothetical protein AW736_07735 [Termitidicoccus mucosus]|uniref:Uncharacterized protein n=1 Tax=Termitidicoccus mucosus TaxID=1184151 RepID=A0A178IMC9_9BACT|nr:hypothetical protein AW736_07735 [Opitutaceae bacterium TSB47]